MAEWKADLERDGFVVLPGLIPAAACSEFRNWALTWLEVRGAGFKRDDKETWTGKHLPRSWASGIFGSHNVGHEWFVWDIRTRPKVLEAFAALWDCKPEDLICSFDGINVSFPVGKHGRRDIEPTEPWPHIDQNPRTVADFELVQGIANMARNGPKDGGLTVIRGSHRLHPAFFAATGGFKPEQDEPIGKNSYKFTEQDLAWYKANGAEEVKVCAGEGDLILWDSRTIHWNASPTNSQTRFVSYVCYCPRSMMDEDALAKKYRLYQTRTMTAHWPNRNKTVGKAGEVLKPPEEHEDLLRLVGLQV